MFLSFGGCRFFLVLRCDGLVLCFFVGWGGSVFCYVVWCMVDVVWCDVSAHRAHTSGDSLSGLEVLGFVGVVIFGIV